ncbi:HAD family hydrolase [Thioclava sp. GXIMD4215]|uniref:HAD family hydrolase n=1 Tax=Thioclava sp. GXIMD4215 TaxID=3131928 RepID=UPI003243BA2D
MAGPALVIFDCDGVLIDSEALSASVFMEELALLGMGIDLDYFARNCLGRAFPSVRARLERDFGQALPEGFEAHYRTKLMTRFSRDLKVMPEVVEAIRRLDRPYHLATSSAPARLAQSLAITGLNTLFEGRCSTASEVRRGKPAPDLFLHVAALYDVAPQDCLVIEDSEVGIAGARAAGMRVWRFLGGAHLAPLAAALPQTPQDPALLGGADLAFHSFAQFTALLSAWPLRPLIQSSPFSGASK